MPPIKMDKGHEQTSYAAYKNMKSIPTQSSNKCKIEILFSTYQTVIF